MSVKTAYRAFFLPEWGGSVLKNAQPHGLPCDLGAWGFSPTSVPMAIIGQRDPACYYLPEKHVNAATLKKNKALKE